VAFDQFRDRTMSFGEHLEELRTYLLRALYGLFVAMCITSYFGDWVVGILTYPLLQQIEPWYRKQIALRVDTFRRAQEMLPPDSRELVGVNARLEGETLAKLSESLGLARSEKPFAPLEFSLALPVADLLDKVAQPMAEVSGRWNIKGLSAQEPFVVYFKSVLGAAVVLGAPWIFYQLYSFVAVGLYAHERRFLMLSLPFSVGLFLFGVFVCYFLVFPRMLAFFLWTNEWLKVDPDIRLNEWVGFCVVLMLIFGVAFQLPLFMLLLDRVGIISHEWMAGQRRMAILILATVSAVVTPGGDPITMIFLAIPLYVLFELGLALMVYFRRHDHFLSSDSESSELSAEI
jgi:sec-independent protein translocase protein TatC